MRAKGKLHTRPGHFYKAKKNSLLHSHHEDRMDFRIDSSHCIGPFCCVQREMRKGESDTGIKAASIL